MNPLDTAIAAIEENDPLSETKLFRRVPFTKGYYDYDKTKEEWELENEH